jgi:receptor-type tyrosine-protein phosphatase gamma
LLQLITSYSPPEFLRTTANAKYNVAKNRRADLVPVDIHRVVLAPKPGVECSDYINASWLVDFEEISGIFL